MQATKKTDCKRDRLSFIFYYIQTVFQKYLALPRLTASALSGALTTCVVLAQLTTIPFLEKAGRRTWFITGACLQTIFLALVTGLSSHPNHRTSAAAAAFTFCFAIVLGSVWSPLPVSPPPPPPKCKLPPRSRYRVSTSRAMMALRGMLTDGSLAI